MSARSWVVLQLVVGAALSLTLPYMSDASWTEAIPLLLALFLLGIFDLKLPNGMTVDMSLTFVPLVVLLNDPVSSLILLVAARLLSSVAAALMDDGKAAWSPSLRRGVVSGIAVALFHQHGPAVLVDAVTAPALVFFFDYALQRVHLYFGRHQVRSPLASSATVVEQTVGAAELSLAVLAVLVYSGTGWWTLLAVSVMLLAMRQSAAMYLQMHVAYDAIVRTLIRAIQAHSDTGLLEVELESTLLADCCVHAARSLGARARDLSAVFYAATFCSLRQEATVPDYRAFLESNVLGRVRFLHGANRLLSLIEDVELPIGSELRANELQLAYLLDSAALLLSGVDPMRAAPHLAVRLGDKEVRLVQEAVVRAAQLMGFGVAMAVEAS